MSILFVSLAECPFCGCVVPAEALSSHTLACSTLIAALDGSYPQAGDAQQPTSLDFRRGCKNINDAAPVVPSHSLDACPVCLVPVSDDPHRVRRAKVCSHEFCAECLETWLSDHVTCPLCVADLSVNGGYRLVADPPPSPAPDQQPPHPPPTPPPASSSSARPHDVFESLADDIGNLFGLMRFWFSQS